MTDTPDAAAPASDAERKVRAVYPDAVCLLRWRLFYVTDCGRCNETQGIGPTEAAAWEDAARRMDIKPQSL